MNLIIEFAKRLSDFKYEAENVLGFKSKINNKYHYSTTFDIGIITSTQDEFISIKKLLLDVEEYETNLDESTIYYSGKIKSKSKFLEVIIPVPNALGIESSIITTTKLLSNFKLKYIFMVGIAAGNKNITKIGDIIIAEKSLNYGQVVEIQKEGKTKTNKFMQSADSIHSYIKTRFDLFANSSLVKEIEDNYSNKDKIKNELKCHVGLMVTGNSLLRSHTKIEELNQSYHGVKGFDMETSGFYYAVTNVPKDNTPYFASIKSVSDFGDNTKHDLKSNERKEYALYTCTNTLLKFINEYIK